MTKKKQGNKESKNDPLTEMKDLLQRTQASFENYKKQMEKRMKEMQQMAARDAVVQLLPVLDNFALALQADTQGKEYSDGVELIYAQLNGILDNLGVEVINTSEKQFDPYYHEALMKVPSEKPENTIVEEFQKGFLLHGQVIRHAKVKVSAGTNTTTGGKK
jgi:molecular chaperone GrpE